MNVTIIAAVAEDGCIGRGGGLPWRLPDDLSRFRRLTLGHPVIMGRRTWDSLPRRPLDRRLNIVLSRSPRAYAGALSTNSLGLALDIARRQGAAEAMVIGGAWLYEEAMPLADRLVLTHVATSVQGGDAHFPDVDDDEWAVVSEEASDGDPTVSYRTYERR